MTTTSEQLAACERRHAEAEKLREQIWQCRVYLRGCMNHAFDDTPIVEVAKDITEEFHRNRLHIQNLSNEAEALRAENEPVTVTEACRPETCHCADYGFPTECYRKTDALANKKGK